MDPVLNGGGRDIFRDIAEQSPNMIFIYQDGSLLYFNHACVEVMGYTPEEFSASDFDFFCLIDSRSVPVAEENLRKHLAGQQVPPYELTLLTKDGHRIEVIMTSRLVGEGKNLILGILTDITDLKEAERSLRLSEEKFSRVFHSSPYGIILTTFPQGCVIEANDSLLRLSGFARERLIGANIPELELWVDLSARDLYLETVERDGYASGREAEFRTKSGEIRTGLISGQLIDLPEGKCLMSVVLDITGQKQVETALEESQALYATLAESSPLGVYIIHEGRFVFVNRKFCELTGFGRKEIMTKSYRDIVHPDDQVMVRENAIAMLKGKRKNAYEYRATIKNGEMRVVLETVSSIQYQGERASLGNYMDITDRKRAEAKVLELETIKEVDRLRSDLLANVSHELRTPLQTIKGYATMMQEYYGRLDEDEKKQYLRSIDDASTRLTNLVDQLLDMSRLEQGMFYLEKSEVDISELMRLAVEESRVRFADHRFELEMSEDLPLLIADSRRIRQVMDNLLDNAAKYSSAETVVTTTVCRQDGQVFVAVADQGKGIAEDDRKKVFDRMYRIEQRLAPQVSGAGLGLAISKGIIETHGGHIWVEGNKNKAGSIFYFTLPLCNNGENDVV